MATPDAKPAAPDASPGLDPRAFDQYAAEYDAALNQGLKFTGEAKEYFAQTRLEWTRALLGTQAGPGWRCLDFGCGTGTASPFIKAAFDPAAITGVDTSAESCALALSQYAPLGATFGHPEDLDAQRDAFDFAYCNGVFHHIPPSERARAVQLVFNALKPGGWFALWENNPWNPITRLLMALVPFDRDAIMLWPGETRRRLATAGFDIVRTDFLFIFPAALAFLRPLERHLCKTPLGAQYLVLARKPAA